VRTCVHMQAHKRTQNHTHLYFHHRLHDLRVLHTMQTKQRDSTNTTKARAPRYRKTEVKGAKTAGQAGKQTNVQVDTLCMRPQAHARTHARTHTAGRSAVSLFLKFEIVCVKRACVQYLHVGHHLRVRQHLPCPILVLPLCCDHYPSSTGACPTLWAPRERKQLRMDKARPQRRHHGRAAAYQHTQAENLAACSPPSCSVHALAKRP